MKFSLHASAAILLLAAAVSGCSTSRMGSMGGEPDAPAPLPASPSGNVQSQPLPPPAQPGGFPDKPTDPLGAAVDPAAGAPNAAAGTGADVSKNGMIGSWRAGGGENCQVFMTLTKLGSMSRGGSRGCSGDLQRMRGWDVKGKQVVLYDDAGNQLAALYNSGGNRYDGQTSSGQAVSLSR